MFDILKDKSVVFRIILASAILVVISDTSVSSLLAAIISLITIVLVSLIAFPLKSLISKTALFFAKLLISIGIVGVFDMVLSVFIKDLVSGIGIHIYLISLAAVLLTETDYTKNNSCLTTLKNSILIGGANALVLLATGIVREFLGMGSIFGLDIYTKIFAPILFFKTVAGGLLTVGVIAIIYNILTPDFSEKREVDNKDKSLLTLVKKCVYLSGIWLICILITYPIIHWILTPLGAEYLSVLALVMVIAFVLLVLSLLTKKYLPDLFSFIKENKTNIVYYVFIMGICLLNYKNQNSIGVLAFLIALILSVIGFVGVCVILYGIHYKLESAELPKSVTGLPIVLITLALIFLALSGFAGI